jgi:4'-phosphopantetheinyl transferase
MRPPRELPLLDPRRLLAAAGPLRTPRAAAHVWAFGSARAAGDAAGVRAACHALLDTAERERAARFLFEEHRHDFVVFHGLLRSILARYLGADPAALRFKASSAGKPSLPGLSFNLSHSADRALLAVTAADPVGADLELERDDLDVLGIAGQYFHGAELEAVRAAASEGPAAARRAFFRHWAAKEAVLKGAGHGLGFPLDRFGVHFGSAGGYARVVTLDTARIAPDWTLRMLEVGGGCPGAVAMRGPDWTLEVAEL